ncbi:MAG: hypothetical protein KDA71_01050, partial [Planctomycetales bacterium]|nr:hypothetical protein [Planctomycetales bacterium]
MLTTWVVAVLLAGGSVGQAAGEAGAGDGNARVNATQTPAASEVDEAKAAAIAKAIEQLGDPRFTTREIASRTLWKFGLAAEPALQEAATRRDAEVRSRARQILEDFSYGILPGTPRDVIGLIAQYRSGDAQTRVDVVQQLLQRERLAAAARLLRKEPDANTRRALLTSVINNPMVVDKFIESENIAALVDAVGADQDANWRRQMTTQLLFAPKMILRLAERKELDQILKVLENEKDDNQRYQLTMALLSSNETVTALVQQKQLPFLLAVAEQHSQANIREQNLLRLIGNQQVLTIVVSNKQWRELWKYGQDKLDDDGQLRLAMMLFQNSGFIDAVMRDPGLEKLVEFLREEENPTQRGRLVARLFMSHLLSNRNDEKIKGLARSLLADLDAPTRREYIGSMLAGGGFYRYFVNDKSYVALWEHIVSDPDRRWRAYAALRLAAYGNRTELKDFDQAILDAFEVARQRDADESEEKPDPFTGQRQPLMDMLLSQFAAVSLLIKQDKADALIEAVQASDEADRGRRWGMLVRVADFVNVLKQKKRLEDLFAFAEQEQDVATRGQYLQSLFSSSAAVDALIEDGRYEQLFRVAEQFPDESQRPRLFASFAVNPKAIERLLKDGKLELIVSLPGKLDAGNQRNFYQQAFGIEPLMEAIIDKDKFKEICQPLLETKDRYSAGMAVQRLVYNGKAIERLRDKQQLDQLMALLAADQAGYGMQVLFQSFGSGRPNVVQILLDAGHFDGLLKLIQDNEQPSNRAQYLGRFVATPSVIEYLAKKKRLTLLFELSESFDDPNLRQSYRTHLFNGSDGIDALMKHDMYKPLLDWISHESDARQRSQMLSQFVRSEMVLKRLEQDKELPKLLDWAKEIDHDQSRMNYLQALQEPRSLERMIEHQLMDDYYALCQVQGDANFRRQLLSALLYKSTALKFLVEKNHVGACFDAALSEPDAGQRAQRVQAIANNAEVLDWLVKHDRVDDLLNAVRGQEPAQSQVVIKLVSLPKLHEQMKANGGLDRLVASLRDVSGANRDQFFQNLSQNETALMYLLQQGHQDMLLEMSRKIGTYPRSRFLGSVPVFTSLAESGKLWDELEQLVKDTPDNERQMVLQTITQPMLYRAGPELLAKHDHCDWLVSFVKSIGDDNTTTQAASRVSDARFRQAWLSQGHADALLALAELSPNEQNRQNYKSLIQRAISGQFGREVIDSQWDRAEAILKSAATDDNGRYALVRFWLATGVFDERVEQLEKQAAEAPEDGDSDGSEPDGKTASDDEVKPDSPALDVNLLIIARRAKGDLAGALALAKQHKQFTLWSGLLIEQRDWAGTLQLMSEPDFVSAPTALPTRGTAGHPDQAKIPALGIRSAYERLAGQREALGKTLDEIERLAMLEPQGRDRAFNAIEALFLEDRPQAALRVMKKALPARAFDVLVERKEFAEALAMVDWPESNEIDKAWLDALPVGADDEAQAALWRFEFALRVVRLRNLLGYRDEALKMLDWLETIAEAAPSDTTANNHYQYGQHQYWLKLAQEAFRLGERDRGWRAIGKSNLGNSVPPFGIMQLFSQRSREAGGWYHVLRQLGDARWQFFPEEMRQIEAVRDGETPAPEAVIAQLIERLFSPHDSDSPEQFESLIRASINELATMHPYTRNATVLGLSETCAKRSRHDLVAELFTHYEFNHANQSLEELTIDLAKRAFDEGDWIEAAERYEAGWQANWDQLGWLYLAGEARERAGETERAAELKRRATALAADAVAMHNLAVALYQAGLHDTALDMFRSQLRTAPMGSFQWHDANRWLAENDKALTAAERVDLWEHYLLVDLHTSFRLLDDRYYIRLPAQTHRLAARAALDSGDAATAEREAMAALELVPGDAKVLEELAPLFDAAGERDRTDRILESVRRHYAAICEQHPRCAYAHNNLAGANARSHRHRDEALRHAEQAVELEPKSGSYV